MAWFGSIYSYPHATDHMTLPIQAWKCVYCRAWVWWRCVRCNSGSPCAGRVMGHFEDDDQHDGSRIRVVSVDAAYISKPHCLPHDACVVFIKACPYYRAWTTITIGTELIFSRFWQRYQIEQFPTCSTLSRVFTGPGSQLSGNSICLFSNARQCRQAFI